MKSRNRSLILCGSVLMSLLLGGALSVQAGNLFPPVDEQVCKNGGNMKWDGESIYCDGTGGWEDVDKTSKDNFNVLCQYRFQRDPGRMDYYTGVTIGSISHKGAGQNDQNEYITFSTNKTIVRNVGTGEVFTLIKLQKKCN